MSAASPTNIMYEDDISDDNDKDKDTHKDKYEDKDKDIQEQSFPACIYKFKYSVKQ